MTASPILVYVDAKILGRNEPTPGKDSFVAYVSEDAKWHGFSSVEADQTDEAEFKAIAFTINDLKSKLQSFTIMCDNESVVSQIHGGIIRLVQDLYSRRYLQR